jgi:hypothetical protein
MVSLNKKAIIKEFVLRDEPTFLIANDIYDHFKEITEEILYDILNSLAENLSYKMDKKFCLTKSQQLSSYHWFHLTISIEDIPEEFYLEFHPYNFFKWDFVYLKGTKGSSYDKDNEKHQLIRDLLKERFTGTNYNIKEDHWYIIGFQYISQYSSNFGNSYHDLFKINKDDKDEKLKNTLFENFYNTYKNSMEIVLEGIDNVYHPN